MAECPSCERCFSTRRGMKQHHSRTHGETLGRDTKTLVCEYCGDSYEKRADRAEESRFCSQDCQTSGREFRERQTEQFVCEVCNSTFTDHASRERRFCSHDCRLDWLHDHTSGDNSPLANQVEQTCDECGESFTRQQSRAELNDGNFCSRDCYHESHTGKDAPNWKGGGVNYYGESWLEQRSAALERDDYECVDCGLTRPEHIDLYGYDLEVHHKTPFRTFDDAADANVLSNLVTVCTSCHADRENA